MTGKLNIGLETTFKIELNPEQEVQVLYQNKTIVDEYNLVLIGEFNTDENGEVQYDDVMSFITEKCTYFLEENNILAILMGLDFNISIENYNTFRIH